ncbi:hypothetical protein L7F22_040779 [Adiantum nelumboides]|nr:hypothetical protein [Adiantum nelumboides]
MAEEEWEWVYGPDHGSPPYADSRNEGYGGLLGTVNAATVTPTLPHLHTNTAQFSENLSSTASSPILKNNNSARVMAKECISAIDALHHSVSEWIEPQLVFTRPHAYNSEGFDSYKAITWLRNASSSKETLVSLLSDPNLCDAVMHNKAFQELACEYTDDVDHLLEGRNVLCACDSSFGRKACILLKEKLIEAIDVLLSLMGTRIFERSVVDNLQETTKSCILLVAVLVFFVIGKRSEEGVSLSHSL